MGFEEEDKSSPTEWGNSLESLQWGWGKVSITETTPLSVLLGWAVSGREQTSCCIADEEDMQRGRQRSDSHGVSGSEPGHFPPRPEANHHNASAFFALFTKVALHISTKPQTYLRVLPEVRACRERGGAIDKRRKRYNRIITQDTSLKGTAVGGPIWALHQQAHTSIATATGSQRTQIVAGKDGCISSQSTLCPVHFLSDTTCCKSIPMPAIFFYSSRFVLCLAVHQCLCFPPSFVFCGDVASCGRRWLTIVVLQGQIITSSQ